jgi:hypothetical protein
MAQKSKMHPALGAMPKAGKGKCGPGMGTMPGTQNNKTMNPTSYAGGKGHPSAGSVPRTKNPAPVYYTNAGRFKAPRAK